MKYWEILKQQNISNSEIVDLNLFCVLRGRWKSRDRGIKGRDSKGDEGRDQGRDFSDIDSGRWLWRVSLGCLQCPQLAQ